MERLASYITPDWPAPSNVVALSTTRIGGESEAPYQGFNLGDHVGDDPETVANNRQLLAQHIGNQVDSHWLQQVHGTDVIDAQAKGRAVKADGATTMQSDLACVVMTADCLPVLFCDKHGQRVAAVHAGWR